MKNLKLKIKKKKIKGDDMEIDIRTTRGISRLDRVRSYDVIKDLDDIKPNITFAQLIKESKWIEKELRDAMKRPTLKELKNLQEKNRKFKRKIRQKQDEVNLLEYKEIKDRTETINSLIEETLKEELNNIEEVEPESEDSTEMESEEDDDWLENNYEITPLYGKFKIKSQEIVIGKDLTKEEQQQLNELLKEFEDIISTDEKPKLGRTGIIKHEVKVTGNPIKGRPYPVKDNKREKWMKEEIERMLKEGIIKKSKSPWASSVVLVSKKDESIRFCVDYKKVNDLMIVDAHPLPIVNDTVNKIGGKKYYTSIDLASGY